MDREPSGSLSTWWTQIRLAAAGASADREHFVRRYQPLVEIYFRARWRRAPLRADIEDGVQEVFLECLKENGALNKAEDRRAGGFRAFLHGIARNVASRIEARRLRSPQALTPDDAVPIDDDVPDRAFLREWAGLMMEEASRELQLRARVLGSAAERRIEILRLRFEENLPIREIAPRLNLTSAQAHKHYAIAREEFSAALHDVVGSHAPSASSAEITTECGTLLTLLET